MLTFIKTIGLLLLSGLNNTEYIKNHNAIISSYKLEPNLFVEREYINEFYPSMNNLIMINKTNIIKEEILPEYKEEIDWRNNYKVSSVKNQGQCGSCWAFSSVGAVESAWAIKKNILYNLSEQELMDCSINNKGCQGGSMDMAFQYIMNNSLCTNLSYPYTAQDGICQKNNCEPLIRISNYSDVSQNNETALMKAVTQQPISIAIQANKRSFQLYKSGIYNDPDCGYNLDHGVLLVGYGYDNLSKMDYWIVKNSWGKHWGEEGYIRLLKNITDTRGQCGIAMIPSYPII